MPSSHLLIEVSTSNDNEKEMQSILLDRQVIIHDGAALFFQRPDFCVFLMTDNTNHWICFYGLPKKEKQASENEVLTFLEAHMSNLSFKFVEIPRKNNETKPRVIRSISGIFNGFVLAYNKKPSIHSILGDGAFVEKISKCAATKQKVPTPPWEEKYLIVNSFDTTSLDDMAQKNQRLNELETKVQKKEERLDKLEAKTAPILPVESSLSSPIEPKLFFYFKKIKKKS